MSPRIVFMHPQVNLRVQEGIFPTLWVVIRIFTHEIDNTPLYIFTSLSVQ